MAISQLAKLLEESVREASEELVEARKDAKEANDKVDSLARRVERFSQALAEERGNHSESVPAIIEQHGSTERAGSELNKSNFARDFLLKNKDRGITGKELSEALRGAGIGFHPNYPNSLLSRLRKGKEIREVRGRYYPVESSTGGE